MNDENVAQRGLEKVSHFFLTGEAPAHQTQAISAEKSTADEAVPTDTVEYDRLENTVAQLYVLRDSCKGMYYSPNPDRDIIWFKGAASILQDAITNLSKTLHSIAKNNKSSKQE